MRRMLVITMLLLGITAAAPGQALAQPDPARLLVGVWRAVPGGTYADDGTYTITLTVTDDSGITSSNTATDTTTVKINRPPTAGIKGVNPASPTITVPKNVAIQLDGSLQVGDWIQLENGRQGRVREIRWRHSVLETRDWGKLIVPNATLLQNLLIGRHTHRRTGLWREMLFTRQTRQAEIEAREKVANFRVRKLRYSGLNIYRRPVHA